METWQCSIPFLYYALVVRIVNHYEKNEIQGMARPTACLRRQVLEPVKCCLHLACMLIMI